MRGDASAGAETPLFPKVAVMGAGAVGCYFGGMLARAGAPVTLIGRPPHVEAIAADGLLLDTRGFSGRVIVEASRDAAAARGAGLVLFAVKTYDTQAAARALAPHLADGATVLSLQNGVENAALLRAATGRDAFPAVVWVAAEMTAPGALTHAGRGDLVIGDETPAAPGAGGRRRALDAAAAVFRAAGVPCVVSENVVADLWAKLAANCAFNPVSALSRARYGRIGSSPAGARLLAATVAEVLAVAAASGVAMESRDALAATMRLTESMPDATSSTAQDLARSRRTEIDALNGFVVRRGEALGVPTPVNRTLAALVRLLEEGR
jgi:2-dehydropantoate 2-reductase